MYMSEMIEERKGSEKVQRHDLLSNLVEANDENLDAINLANSELIGILGLVLKRLKHDPLLF